MMSQHIQDSPQGSKTVIDLLSFEKDIVDLAKNEQLLSLMTNDVRLFVTGKHHVYCQKVRLYLLLSIMNKCITHMSSLKTKLRKIAQS